MAKSNVFDWSTTAGDNTDVGGISIAESCPAANINNAIREAMAEIRREVAGQGTAIASAATCNIAASNTSGYVHITGTTAITGFGTAPAGTRRVVEFDGALTLTHHATSLILPGQVNIATAAGDVAFLVSLGSGNWKCLAYAPISGSVVGGFSSVTATSTTADATAGPDISAYRNSASPADNDLGGRFVFKGRDDAANEQIYGALASKFLDVSSTTEDAEFYLQAVIAGALTTILTWGQGVGIGSVTMPGAGKMNVESDVQIAGKSIAPAVLVYQDQKSNGTNGGTPVADTWTKRTCDDLIINTSAITHSSSVFTMPVGKWLIHWSMTFYNVTSGYSSRCRNTSDGTTIGLGTTGTNTGLNVQSVGNAYIEVTSGTKDIQLEYSVGTGVTNGLGLAGAPNSELEVYCTLSIQKVG